MHSALRIGGLELASPVVLAPMAGYSDLPFRLMLRKQGGVGMAFSEMLSPHSILLGGGRRRREMLATVEEDRPLGYQLYGTDPTMMAEAARWLASEGAVLIDINMGCPKHKISCRGAGAGLLRDPDLAVEIAERVVSSVSVPVTAKMRLGWDDGSFVAADLARRLEQCGVAGITVHGRTRDQGYSGEVRLPGIRRVVEAVERIPVIGNGDVTSVQEALSMVENTGCAGIMVGRGAVKDPWLLRDVSRSLRGLPPLPAPSLGERWARFREFLELTAAHYGDGPTAVIFRKWIPPNASRLRISREELLPLLKISEMDLLRREMDRLRAVKVEGTPSGIGSGVSG